MELEPLTLFEIIVVIFLLFIINLDLIFVEKNKSVGVQVLSPVGYNSKYSKFYLEKFYCRKLGRIQFAD